MTDALRIAEEVIRRGGYGEKMSALAKAVLDYEKKLREADKALVAMFGAEDHQATLLLGMKHFDAYEAARARETSRTGEKP